MFVKGHVMSQETKDKISRAVKARPPMSKEVRLKISNTLKGHSFTPEVKDKIAKTLDQTGDLINQRFGEWLVLE